MLNPQVDRIIRLALEEDIGTGDITSQSLVPESAKATGRFLVKQPGVLAGIRVARRVFEILDPAAEFTILQEDGTRVTPGDIAAEVKASARTVLAGERTALNFVQRLSGIATLTADVVEQLEGTTTRLLDTRKTTPGLRALEKHAVKMGGGTNHRTGLFDAVLIKNNHLKFATPIEAIERARAGAPATATIEIEVETFEQLEQALQASPDIIMLDNMDVERMRAALEIIQGRARVEVSGNVTRETIPTLARLGVTYISMGALTHSAKALDLSLRVEPR